jgi:glycine reductase
MRLTLAIHPITEMHFGDATRLDGTSLVIDQAALAAYLLEDAQLESVDLDIVYPGEACRFGAVFDVLEPRAKEPGDGPDFPGVLGPVELVGRGTTHVLRGSALSVLEDGAAGRIMEMGGVPGAASAYGSLHHLVVAPHPRAGLERHLVQSALRRASAKAAAYLARAAIGHPPADTEVFEILGPADPALEGLPRFAYIGQVYSRQRVPEVDEHILYGVNTAGMLPTLLHPNEWLDGALFIGYRGLSVETYFHQNQPVILELYRRHREGKINFVGTIATMAASDNVDRDRLCMMAASLAKWNLGADGVVLTKDGGGAPHADMAYTAKLCEEMGIRTVVQVGPPDLSADRTAESAALFNYPEVDAIVYSSGGGYVEWPAPPVERVIAASEKSAAALADLKQVVAGSVPGITSQQGASRLRTIVF